MQATEPERILAQLGATAVTLTERERSALDDDGFVVLERIAGEAQIAAMRSAVDELLAASRRDLTKRHGGTLHLDDILDCSEAFDPAWTSPRLLAAEITQRIPIPTIGIGAGPHCDGQVLVLHDVLGLYPDAPPFAKRYANIGETATTALRTYADDVRAHTFPTERAKAKVTREANGYRA